MHAHAYSIAIEHNVMTRLTKHSLLSVESADPQS